MSCGIYCITHKPTGERYIGYSRSIWRRWLSHMSSLKHRRHKSAAMQRAFDTGGRDGFELSVLQVVQRDSRKLIDAERRWLRKLPHRLNHAQYDAEQGVYQGGWQKRAGVLQIDPCALLVKPKRRKAAK